MRVGFVTQWYDPEQGSAALPGVISRALAGFGHDVEVLTGFPNYPGGELYPGYAMKHYQRETIQGLTVHRAPLWVNHDTNALRRVGNYASFAMSSAGVALSKLRQVDAIWVHSTPATVAVPAIVLKRLRGIPYVIHVQDLWPDTVTASDFFSSDHSSVIERSVHRFCDAVYRGASMVAVTSPGMLTKLVARGVPEDKMTFLPNWADEEAFRPIEDRSTAKRRLGLKRRFSVMYAGNFGQFQGLDIMVRAAEELRSRSDIEFVLVGGGVEEALLRESVQALGLDSVTFVGPQPFSAMADVLAAGDVQLISLQDRPLSHLTLPSKIQATLSAGRPVIGALSGDAVEVVRESGAGLVITPGSGAELAAAVSDLAARSPEALSDMGRSARKYYETHFAQKRMVARMSSLLEQAVMRRA